MGQSGYYHFILIFESVITYWLFGSMCYHSLKYHFQCVMSFYVGNISEAGVICQSDLIHWLCVINMT